MKFTYLSRLMGGGILATASIVPAQAVVLDNNLRNGLDFMIGSSISPAIVESSQKSTYHYGDSRAFDVYYGDPTTPVKLGTVEDVLANQNKKETDERARLDGFGSAVVWFVASQRLTRNTTIEGEIDLYGSQEGLYPSSFGLTFYNDMFGSVGIKTDSGMVTSGANMTQTFNNLDYAGSAVTVSYTNIPNLTLSAYHAFPATEDTRYVDASLHGGHGVYARYVKPFAPKHSLTGAMAYTHGKRHVELSSDSIAKKKNAYGIGLQYQYQDITLSLDGSRSDETLSGALVDNIDSNAYGVRLAYQATPRLSAYAYYGERDTKKVATQGNNLSFDTLIGEVARSANGVSGLTYDVLFDKVAQKRYGIGTSYNLYRGISLSASVGKDERVNYLTDGKFSETDTAEYRIGMNFRY